MKQKKLNYEAQPKDESKEVKEGEELFTGGEWIVNNFWHVEANGVNIGGFNPYLPESENKANAALLAQSKNMYYALKEILQWVKVKDGRAEWKTSAAKISELKQLLDKATPKK